MAVAVATSCTVLQNQQSANHPLIPQTCSVLSKRLLCVFPMDLKTVLWFSSTLNWNLSTLDIQ